MANDHAVNILLRARDQASKSVRGLNRELSRTGKIAKIAGKGVGNAFANIGRLGVVAGGVVVGGFVAAAKAAGDFEAQLNTINTVARLTPDALTKVGDTIREIARKTGTPLEELTQGYYDLVSAGISVEQANRVLAASNTLAIGGLASAAEGVDLITTALNSYGVSADKQGGEAERFADIFAKSIERGKVTASELAASFAGVGPLAASMKVEIEEIAAGYAQMTAKGVPAAEAATQMSAAMISLQRQTGPMKKLQKQTGHNYAAIAGSKGLAVAFETMRKDAAKAKVPLIELVGRQEALAFALNTTGTSFAGYNANLAEMRDANGTAAGQMGERNQGLNFQLARLKALAKDAAITIGSKLLPKLTPLAEKAVAFLELHQDDIARFGDKMASAFDKAVEFAQKIPWGAIGSGLQQAAEWSGRLFQAFASMPPEVQGTIVALAGLNKLSGGAIGGIVGELGKGIIKGVLGMNAGVVNINAGVVNGGGGGLPGAAGGGAKGLLGKAATIALPAAILVGALKVAQDNVVMPKLQEQAGKNITGTQDLIANGSIAELKTALSGLREMPGKLDPLKKVLYDLNASGVKTHNEGLISAIETRLKSLESSSRTSTDQSVRAMHAGWVNVSSAINAIDFSPRITIPVHLTNMVSNRSITTGQKTIARYGQVGHL